MLKMILLERFRCSLFRTEPRDVRTHGIQEIYSLTAHEDCHRGLQYCSKTLATVFSLPLVFASGFGKLLSQIVFVLALSKICGFLANGDTARVA